MSWASMLQLCAASENCANGAEPAYFQQQLAGFSTGKPDFSGHGVCSAYPYVQGLTSPTPFHPTAAGQLVIALADQSALHATAE